MPDYAGPEPIKQALENNETEIILSAHYLEPKIDSGDVISVKKYNLKNILLKDLEKQIQEIRDEITPLFSEIILDTLEILNDKK